MSIYASVLDAKPLFPRLFLLVAQSRIMVSVVTNRQTGIMYHN